MVLVSVELIQIDGLAIRSPGYVGEIPVLGIARGEIDGLA